MKRSVCLRGNMKLNELPLDNNDDEKQREIFRFLIIKETNPFNWISKSSLYRSEYRIQIGVSGPFECLNFDCYICLNEWECKCVCFHIKFPFQAYRIKLETRKINSNYQKSNIDVNVCICTHKTVIIANGNVYRSICLSNTPMKHSMQMTIRTNAKHKCWWFRSLWNAKQCSENNNINFEGLKMLCEENR